MESLESLEPLKSLTDFVPPEIVDICVICFDCSINGRSRSYSDDKFLLPTDQASNQATITSHHFMQAITAKAGKFEGENSSEIILTWMRRRENSTQHREFPQQASHPVQIRRRNKTPPRDQQGHDSRRNAPPPMNDQANPTNPSGQFEVDLMMAIEKLAAHRV
jgi:hypothetical protein